jgi:hypothetical protein
VTPDEWALIELRHHWDAAYEITDRPGWRARRRDGKGGWITAPDAETLAELIRADYTADPVPRDLDG